jgi:uncharacterized membrane protein
VAIGPVQLIVSGFPDPDVHGEIIDELERLRQSDTVRVTDALAVYKDRDGELEAMHLSNLSEDEAIELGGTVVALVGPGFAVGPRDAVFRAGGYRVSDGSINPVDLIGVGLVTADEAAAMNTVETASAAA